VSGRRSGGRRARSGGLARTSVRGSATFFLIWSGWLPNMGMTSVRNSAAAKESWREM
jgi:hypothetical protein